MLRRTDADTTSYVADYLRRSVRRASGFVLVGDWEIEKLFPRNTTPLRNPSIKITNGAV